MPPHETEKTDVATDLPPKFKNPHAGVTIGDLWAFGNHLNAGLEKHLQKFQGDLIAWQHQIISAWNTMNVVVRVLQKKGLLDEEMVRQAGEELAAEAKENHRRAKEVKTPEQATEVRFIPSPIEQLERVYKVNPVQPTEES